MLKKLLLLIVSLLLSAAMIAVSFLLYGLWYLLNLPMPIPSIKGVDYELLVITFFSFFLGIFWFYMFKRYISKHPEKKEWYIYFLLGYLAPLSIPVGIIVWSWSL